MRDAKCSARVVTRPFVILDVMILVVAFALAFLVLRSRYESWHSPFGSPTVYRTINLTLTLANSILMAFTLALTLIALRKPRAKLQVLLRRPGPAACVAAFAAMVVMIMRISIKSYSFRTFTWRVDEPFRLSYIYPQLVGHNVRIGFAVLGAWLMLLLTRSWRSEPSWMDRAGRMVGWGWILLLLFHVLLPWIEPFLPAI